MTIKSGLLEAYRTEGGFYVTPPAFLQRLRKFCGDDGILLIADEIQSGFARTVKMFAIEHSGVEPELMTVALVQNRDPSQPLPDITRQVGAEAANEGLILLSCGIRGNVIRFLPALTATDAVIDEGLDILLRILDRLTRHQTRKAVAE